MGVAINKNLRQQQESSNHNLIVRTTSQLSVTQQQESSNRNLIVRTTCHSNTTSQLSVTFTL